MAGSRGFIIMKKSYRFVLSILLVCFMSAAIPLFAESVSYGDMTFDKSEINSFDRPFMNAYSKPLDYTATGLELASLMTPLFLIPAPSQDYWKLGVEYAETIALAWGAKELAKHCVTRYRPYMYFDGAPQSAIDDGDYKDSFFSGHATLSFAAAGFTTYQALTYLPDSPYKWMTIGVSYALCTTTAVLRLASGNHFMTDVLCGALVGSALGFLIPWVNHYWFEPSIDLPPKTALMVAPVGINFSVRF